MKCPSCGKAEVIQEISLSGIVFNRKKKIVFYCPMCPFNSKKDFQLNEDEYQLELEKKKRVNKKLITVNS
jgi:rubredoxin